MSQSTKGSFSISVFLATLGPGRTVSRFKGKQVVFAQGSKADSVFYLQSGRAKHTVVSKGGKEATVTLLSPGDFFGEESMVDAEIIRTSTASSLGTSSVLKITRDVMLDTLRDEHEFSFFFLKFVLVRGIRTQGDLVDQLFNSSERRLARTLLLMAEFGDKGEPAPLLPSITQEVLAEMIGTTRSRVSFFMNRFRKLGFIDYNGHIRVNKALLNMVLRDELPEQNAVLPAQADVPVKRTRVSKTKSKVAPDSPKSLRR